MSGDLTKTLQDKITTLHKEKISLREKISAIEGKLELLKELLGESSGSETSEAESPDEPGPDRRPARLRKSSSQELRNVKDPQREALQGAIKEITEQLAPNKHGAQTAITGRDGIVKVSL